MDGRWQRAAGNSDFLRSQLAEGSTGGAKCKAQSGKRRRQLAADNGDVETRRQGDWGTGGIGETEKRGIGETRRTQ